MQQNLKLKIISKLMNEREYVTTNTRRSFERLCGLIEEKLPKELDKGIYTDNSSVIRRVNRILAQKEIFTILPQLAERTVFLIWNHCNEVDKNLKNIFPKALNFKIYENIPLLILPDADRSRAAIQTLTYMDKIVPISQDEYKCLTQEMNNDKIGIRKLVKCFILSLPQKYANEAFLVLSDTNTEETPFLEGIYSMVLKNNIIQGSAFTKAFADQNNYPCINFMVVAELQNVFLDVDVYYKRKMNEMTQKVKNLAEDSINLKEGKVKTQVQKYRSSILAKQEELKKNYVSFCGTCDQIVKAAEVYEQTISKRLLSEIGTQQQINTDAYCNFVLRVFFKHIYAE